MTLHLQLWLILKRQQRKKEKKAPQTKIPTSITCQVQKEIFIGQLYLHYEIQEKMARGLIIKYLALVIF